MVTSNNVKSIIKFLLTSHTCREDDRNLCFCHSGKQRQIGEVTACYLKVVRSKEFKHRKTLFCTKCFNEVKTFLFSILVNLKVSVIIQLEESSMLTICSTKRIIVYIRTGHLCWSQFLIKISASHLDCIHWFEVEIEYVFVYRACNKFNDEFGNIN